jgi:hypothetical protein
MWKTYGQSNVNEVMLLTGATIAFEATIVHAGIDEAAVANS